MIFTPTAGGSTTIGLGQFASVDGHYAIEMQMQMQMITGSTLLITHWAHMLPITSGVTPTPATSPPQSGVNTGYSWTKDPKWKMSSPALFGSNAQGTFVVNNYTGGYFNGLGVGPANNPVSFSQLGSITPEGKVLFATLADGSTVLNTSYGVIVGPELSATMSLADYNNISGERLGTYTYLTLIKPYSISVEKKPAALGAANNLWSAGLTSLGLTGDMAPVIVLLDNLSGEALSNALNKTVPLLAGASSMATTQLQRNFNQLIQSRQTQLTGFSTGEKFVGNRNEWATVFGNRGKQGKTKNVSGYSVGSGGLAFGFDTQFSAETNIGVGFAYTTAKLIVTVT